MPARRLLTVLLVAGLGGLLAFAGAQTVNVKSTAAAPAAVKSEAPVDRVWTALVLATNSADPKPAPPELKALVPRMKGVFGYNQFELAGSASQVIDNRQESWLVPSKNFSLGLRARRAMSKEAQGGYLLSLQFFQDKRELVETEVKLAPGSPLFIRGPQYGKGQLIVVLQIQR